MGKKYCRNCRRYYLGEVCPNCKTDSSKTHNLTDNESNALKEACTWYNKHYLGYPAGKYYNCFFGDIQKALCEILNSTEKKYSKSLKDNKFGNTSHFVRLLTYAWEYGHLPVDFEERLKGLHSISVEKVNNSKMLSNIIELRNAQTMKHIADFI
jgi:hypothetical protein